ncbi:MAG: Gldg family protein [Candidatus Glassbacteria bacterium]|nr:Gldg family protein [Candidatus Glassbacteria bacterium]
MTAKHSQEKISIVLLVIIVLAIVGVVNLLADRFFRRVDLTENQVYTVSRTTRRMLSELDDVVSVRAYFSKKLPVQLNHLPGEVDDLLSEYRISSGGNVTYERLDPAEDEALAKSLAGRGVRPVQMTVVEKDERQQINGYLAMTVSHGEQTEVIPVVQNTNDLEYELTSRIYRVTHEPRRVGFVSTGSRHDLEGDYSQFAEEVSKLHEIVPVNLSGGKKVPGDIETLILAGPDSTSQEEQYALDQFIMRGGRLLLMVDKVLLDQRGMPSLVEHGLEAMLSSYGFRLNGNLIADKKSHSPRTIRRGFFIQQQPFPLFPRVGKQQLGEHPVVARLSGFTLPYAGSLEFTAADDSAVVYTTLALSTDETDSYAPPVYQPSPNARPVILVGLGTGTFQSYFKDKPRPASAGEGEFLEKCGTPTSILVIPCSSLLTNELLYPGNLEFILNVVDFMTIGDDLISIRTRPNTDRPLMEISAEMKKFLRLLNILGVPVLVVLFGMMRFYLKKRDKAIRARAI